MLSERFRPRRLKDVAGNPAAITALRRWAAGWAPGASLPRHRAALLEGRAGVGKTTAAWALAEDEGWSVVEMNASEARNRDAIERIAGRAALTSGFGSTGEYIAPRAGGRTLILLDEADCLTGRLTEESSGRVDPPNLREFLRGRYRTIDALARAWGLGGEEGPRKFERWEDVPTSPGRAAWARLRSAQSDLAEWRSAGRRTDLTDRGGLAAIAQLVRSTRQPVVLTVNDASPLTRYSPLFRTGVARIRFDPVAESAVRSVLRRIILEERLTVPTPVLEAILRRSAGDLRAAVNDLEAIGPLPAVAAQLEVLGGRDRSTELEAFTGEVLHQPRLYRSVEVSARLDTTPEDLFPWIEENAPRAARGAADRLHTLELLGRAELFLARARRERVYSLWSYATEIMTGGVSCAVARPAGHEVPIRFPSFLADMGRTRAARQLRRAVLGKVAPVLHLSVRKANAAMLPELFFLFDPPRPAFASPLARSFRAALIRRSRLGAEEVAFLMGDAPDSPRVAEELARAEATVGPPGSGPVPHDTERATDGPAAARPPPPPKPPRRTVQRRLGAE